MGAVQNETRRRKRKAGAEDVAKSNAVAAPRAAVNDVSLNDAAAVEDKQKRREQQQQFEKSSKIVSKKRRRLAEASSSSSSSVVPSAAASSRAAGSSAAVAASSSSAPAAAKEQKHSPGAATAAAGGSNAQDKAAVSAGEVVAGMVPRQLLRRALTGLTQFVLKRSSSNSSSSSSRLPTPLLQDPGSETVSLMVSLKQIPTHFKKTPILIDLPHSLLERTSEVCLIVRDPQRKWKDALGLLQTKEGRPLLHVTKVVGVKKLKKKFPTYRDRRALCAAFDLFLADKKVLNQAYEALGKSFAQAKKLPLPVRLSSTNLRPSLEKAMRTTAFFLPRGPSIAVKIGRAYMPQQHLEDNACAVLEALQDFFSNPTNKWRNTIHTIAVQATDAPALPLYVHPAYATAAAATAAAARAAAAATGGAAGAGRGSGAGPVTAAAAGGGRDSRRPRPATRGGAKGEREAEREQQLKRVKKGKGLNKAAAAAEMQKKRKKKSQATAAAVAAAASPATSSLRQGGGKKKDASKKK